MPQTISPIEGSNVALLKLCLALGGGAKPFVERMIDDPDFPSLVARAIEKIPQKGLLVADGFLFCVEPLKNGQSATYTSRRLVD